MKKFTGLLKKNYIISTLILVFFSLAITVYIFLAFDKRLWPFQDGGLIHSYFKTEDYKADAYWANEIKKGGYVLHFRHGQREKWDTVTAYDAYEIINNIDARNSSFYRATCLTKRGIEDAKLISKVLEHAEIPIGKIISSPSCRAKETAIFAFGKVDQYDTSILHATAVDPDEWDFMAERYKNLLLDNASKNYNLIISGHGNTVDKYYTRIFEKKDLPPSRKISNILEAGFYVFKVENGKIFYKHKFYSLRNFAMHIFSLKDY